MTVAEVQERMSVAEFIEWQAFLAVEPMGEARADLRMALQMRQQALMWKAKNSSTPDLVAFMPDWWAALDEQPLSAMTLAEKFRMATSG